MIDINLLRSDPEKVKQGVSKKGVVPSLIDDILKTDEDWRNATSKLEDLRSKRNKISKELAKGRTPELLEKASDIKSKITDLENRQKELGDKRDEGLRKLPNLPFSDVPEGKSEEDNVVVREVGELPNFDFEPKDHLELGEALGIIDVESAAKVSGSRFNYLLGDAVLLEFGLVKLVLDILTKEDFKPVIPPVLAREETMRRWGKGDFIDNEEAFSLPKDELTLVGSSEHTIGPLHMDKIFNEKDLPLRYIGFSSCFRREAGSYGKDTKGIIRVHQFDKLEMFSVCSPDKSEDEHSLLVSLQEKILSKLGLPYRVVEICTGDMTWVDARQYDIETWIPSQSAYRETNSASNTTDFQSRGVNARYKKKDGSMEYLHMLNATAIAVGRILVAILENYQNKDGSVTVPDILRDYLGKDVIK